MPIIGMASGQEILMSYFRVYIKNYKKHVGVNCIASTLRAYKYAYQHMEKFLNEKYKRHAVYCIESTSTTFTCVQSAIWL